MTSYWALMQPDKMMKENGELRESEPPLKHSIKDLRASKCALEESLISAGLKVLGLKCQTSF